MNEPHTNPSSHPKPTIESVESNPQTDDSAIVTDPEWDAVGSRVHDELADAVEIIQTAGEGEPIHEWDDAADAWTATTSAESTSVCFTHDSGAWLRIVDSSVSRGFNVLVCAGPEAVPQRSLWSTREHGYLLPKCESHAVAKMLQYARDGAF